MQSEALKQKVPTAVKILTCVLNVDLFDPSLFTIEQMAGLSSIQL